MAGMASAVKEESVEGRSGDSGQQSWIDKRLPTA